MYCRHCGAVVPDGAQFCPQCGVLIKYTDSSTRNTADSQEDPYAYRQDTQNFDHSYAISGTPVKDDRDFWVFLLLTFLTCGIYQIYFMYKLVEDVNVICADDGQETPNYIVMLLLTMITCGIYGYIWYYNLGNRLRNYAETRYGLGMSAGGTELLLLMIFGLFSGSVTVWIAHYLLIQNVNMLAIRYNDRLAGDR